MGRPAGQKKTVAEKKAEAQAKKDLLQQMGQENPSFKELPKNANAMTSTTLTNAFRQPRTTTTPVSETLAPVTPVSETLVSSTPVSSAPISVQKRLQFGNSEDLKVLVQEGKRLRFP